MLHARAHTHTNTHPFGPPPAQPVARSPCSGKQTNRGAQSQIRALFALLRSFQPRARRSRLKEGVSGRAPSGRTGLGTNPTPGAARGLLKRCPRVLALACASRAELRRVSSGGQRRARDGGTEGLQPLSWLAGASGGPPPPAFARCRQDLRRRCWRNQGLLAPLPARRPLHACGLPTGRAEPAGLSSRESGVAAAAAASPRCSGLCAPSGSSCAAPPASRSGKGGGSSGGVAPSRPGPPQGRLLLPCEPRRPFPSYLPGGGPGAASQARRGQAGPGSGRRLCAQCGRWPGSGCASHSGRRAGTWRGRAAVIRSSSAPPRLGPSRA